MPVYNEGKFIAKSIESLLRQDYKNIELIITDNNSQDNTQEICLKYAKEDYRVRYYRNRTNTGSLRNSNFAFELSKGEYFMWAGAHDLWDQSFIGRCVHILNSDPDVVVCYTLGFLIDSEDRPISPWGDNIDTRNLKLEERLHKILEMKAGLAFCSLMRSNAMERIMPFKREEIAGCDLLFLFELGILGSFALINEPLFYLRKTREEKSEEETVRRVLKQINIHRDQYKSIFETQILDFYDHYLQIIDKLKIERERRSFLLRDVIHCLKNKHGESSLREIEKLMVEIKKRFSGIKDLDFSSIRDAHLALKYVNIGLLFHPKSSILQEAYHLLIQLNHGRLVDANAALCAKGKQALESGNINEAIEIYLKVLQTNPIDEAALCGLGLAYQMDGKTDKTIDAYRKALKANPLSFDANYNLALVYANNNQIDDAIAHLNKAINLNDSDASVHNNLGVLYFKKNMHNDARNCFERALQIDAHYKEAQQNLKKVSKVGENG